MSEWFNRAMAGVALWLCLLPCWAITPEQEVEFQAQVDKELQEMVDFLVDEKKFCTEYLGLEYPVKPPTEGVEALDKVVETRVQEEAFRRYPEGQRMAFFKEALEQFSLHKLGDLVKVATRNDERPIEGRLRQINEFDVLVDNKTVRYEDMEPDTLARFRKETSERRITQYVELKMRQWESERAQFILERRDRIEHEIFGAAGYVLKLGEWIPLETFFKEELERHRGEIAERLRPLLTTRVYMDAGYRLYKEIWMTAAEIAQIEALEQKKNEFEPEFEAGLDKLNAENDQFTAGGTRVEGGQLW